MQYVDLSEALTGFSLDKVVVFDTETTGITPTEDEVLSIAICDADGTELFSTLVKPSNHTSWPDAQKINGISPRDVRDAPTIKELAPEIRKHLLGNKLIVGYNVAFDIQFLIAANVFKEWPDAFFDVMKEYATVYGKRPSRFGSGYAWSKLVDCASFFGYSFAAHDALEDAKATAYCYKALLCDATYLSQKVSDLISGLQHVQVRQTKKTSANVVELVEQGITSKTAAELRLGQVLSGKNKGNARYECFLGDRCLGLAGLSSTDAVRRLFCIADGEPLPESIPCTVLLSKTKPSVTCNIDIQKKDTLKTKILEAARNEHVEVRSQPKGRPQSAEGTTAATAEGATSVATKRAAPAEAPVSPKAAEQQKVTGCVLTVAIVVLAFFVIYAFTCGYIVIGFVLIVLVNILFAFAMKLRKEASKEV